MLLSCYSADMAPPAMFIRRLGILLMKKTYDKPTLVRRECLGVVAGQPVPPVAPGSENTLPL